MFSVLLVSSGSAIAATNAQVSSLDERIRSTEVKIADNNVPELKHTISERFDKIDQNLFIIQKQNLENYKQICKLTEGNC